MSLHSFKFEKNVKEAINNFKNMSKIEDRYIKVEYTISFQINERLNRVIIAIDL